MTTLTVLYPPKSLSFTERLQRQLDSEVTTKDWTTKALTHSQQHYQDIDNWDEYKHAKQYLNQAY